ncbi:class I SAM-dependent methyltransferase [Eubacteriales bacterium OttesenSCG-928-N13]|nr:class I SAM-dependent methyltransferase [Eubacteriales bacterium OttesenSCG-928-N13]
MQGSNIFDQMATRYDTPDRVENARIIARAIRAELGDASGGRCLDCGCGTGLVGLELLDLFDSMLFVDTAPQMVEQVQRKLDAAHIESADTLCCDLCSAEADGLEFDCAVMSQVLLHVPDYLPLLTRIHALLPHGGQLIIVDFDKNERIPSDRVHNGFEQSVLIQQLLQIGFSSADAHTFHHGQKIFMNQDASMFILHAIK